MTKRDTERKYFRSPLKRGQKEAATKEASEEKSQKALWKWLLHPERDEMIQFLESLILAQDERWRRA